MGSLVRHMVHQSYANCSVRATVSECFMRCGFSRIHAYCNELNHACLTGESSGHRGYATELTAGMTLLNKGLKAGPGGRSSVSFRAHV